MTKKCVYKVLVPVMDLEGKEKYLSYASSLPSFPNKLILSYSLGNKTYPIKDTYLFSFITLHHAYMFLSGIVKPRYTILKCLADVEERIVLAEIFDIMVLKMMDDDKTLLEELTKLFSCSNFVTFTRNLVPSGTVFCKWIMPISIEL